MLAGREDLGWITDGDPADRHCLSRRQHRVDVNHPVDAYFRSGPHRTAGNSAAPVARKHPSHTRVPFRCACGPMSTSVPIIDACPARPRTRAFSMTTVRSPTRISPSSAVSTAPNKMRASAPTKTAPHKTAVGATYALGGPAAPYLDAQSASTPTARPIRLAPPGAASESGMSGRLGWQTGDRLPGLGRFRG
jgi:hypothetical protein